jgi:aspartate/methionine/tyrosine aminotransferase
LPNLDFIPPDILPRARMLWLNYPNNPTAAVAPLEFFESVVAFACQHNLLLCHDAAYAQVAFDGYKPPSLLQAPARRSPSSSTHSKSHGRLAGGGGRRRRRCRPCIRSKPTPTAAFRQRWRWLWRR